ncbi:MAG: Mut7-C RNAse domain-containing protein [Burkholderiales bacterium]
MPEPRFLCDEMLGRLCRYLRAAGYDAALARGGEPDARLLQQAIAEERIFLTCDQKILEHNAAREVAVVLPTGNLNQLAAFLKQHLGLDWLHAPFSRCLVDNRVLRPADRDGILRIPQDARRAGERFMACPACGRVYWRGSHLRRMMGYLQRWAEG